MAAKRVKPRAALREPIHEPLTAKLEPQMEPMKVADRAVGFFEELSPQAEVPELGQRFLEHPGKASERPEPDGKRGVRRLVAIAANGSAFADMETRGTRGGDLGAAANAVRDADLIRESIDGATGD